MAGLYINPLFRFGLLQFKYVPECDKLVYDRFTWVKIRYYTTFLIAISIKLIFIFRVICDYQQGLLHLFNSHDFLYMALAAGMTFSLLIGFHTFWMQEDIVSSVNVLNNFFQGLNILESKASVLIRFQIFGLFCYMNAIVVSTCIPFLDCKFHILYPILPSQVLCPDFREIYTGKALTLLLISVILQFISINLCAAPLLLYLWAETILEFQCLEFAKILS